MDSITAKSNKQPGPGAADPHASPGPLTTVAATIPSSANTYTARAFIDQTLQIAVPPPSPLFIDQSIEFPGLGGKRGNMK